MNPELQALSEIRGYHTEMVTLYLPAKVDLRVVSKTLQSELSAASCIKDRANGNAVTTAIKSCI